MNIKEKRKLEQIKVREIKHRKQTKSKNDNNRKKREPKCLYKKQKNKNFRDEEGQECAEVGAGDAVTGPGNVKMQIRHHDFTPRDSYLVKVSERWRGRAKRQQRSDG